MRTRWARGTYALLSILVVNGCNCDEGGLVDASSVLLIEPAEVDFLKVPVGTERVRGLKLTNDGQSIIRFDSVTLASDSTELALASTPPEQILPAQSIDLLLVYQPNDVGEDLGTLTIVSDEREEPHVVPVRGEGVVADAAVSHGAPACTDAEGSLSFGGVVPGQTKDETITITAQGTAPVTIVSVVTEPGTSPEFTIEDAVDVVLDPGGTLDLVATYAPVDGGPDSGVFVVTTDIPSTIRIPVCGQGVAPAVCASPVPLDFGAMAVGQTRVETITLESCGGEDVTISGVEIANTAMYMSDAGYRLPMAVSTPVTLAPGETVDVEVEVTISQLGVAEGWLHVQSDALNATDNYFPLSARGAQPCDLQVLPDRLTFTNVMVGSTLPKQVFLANLGARDCTVNRAEITTGATVFSVRNVTVPFTIASGGSVPVEVVYAPTAAGMPDMGILEVEEGGVPRQIELLGNPDTSDGCFVDIAPTALNYGAVPPGQTKTLGVVVTNVGQDPCLLRSVELAPGTSPDFLETSPSFGLIIPGRDKTLTVTYTPTSPGTASGSVNIGVSEVGGSATIYNVPLVAVSAAAGLCVMPRQIDFGPTQTQATQSFNIIACGSNPVTVTALDWTMPDPEFTLTPGAALPFTLMPGNAQAVDVTYTPTDAMGDTGEVTVRSNDPAAPAIPVTITGGPELVPPSAGRFLYYWQIPSPVQSDVMRLPLQGNTAPSPWWGSRTGKACSGCHSVSPDGRYVAVIEASAFRMVDTTTDIALSVPNSSISPAYVSWKPDINTNPPYQYAYDTGAGDIAIAGLFVGTLRELQGANDSAYAELMPSWGPNGQIAYARGTQTTGGQGGTSFGFQGPADIMIIDENGGTPVPLAGASGGTGANYYPRYSPNGQWIAYTYSAMASSTIAAADAVVLLAAAANNNTILPLNNLNSPGSASSYPTWSVDGQFLSFSSNRAGGQGDWDIYLAPIDPMTGADSAATNLTAANSPAFEHSAQWSP